MVWGHTTGKQYENVLMEKLYVNVLIKYMHIRHISQIIFFLKGHVWLDEYRRRVTWTYVEAEFLLYDTNLFFEDQIHSLIHSILQKIAMKLNYVFTMCLKLGKEKKTHWLEMLEFAHFQRNKKVQLSQYGGGVWDAASDSWCHHWGWLSATRL